MKPEPPGTACLPGADSIWPEPASAPGPSTSGAGAAKNSGSSATLVVGAGGEDRTQIVCVRVLPVALAHQVAAVLLGQAEPLLTLEPVQPAVVPP